MAPKCRVSRFEKHTLNAANIAHVFRLDTDHVVGHMNYATRAEQFGRIKLMHASCAVDEMIRRINVGRGVDAECGMRDICCRSSGDRFERRYLDARIALVDRRFSAYSYGYVIYFHEIRIIDSSPLGKTTRSE